MISFYYSLVGQQFQTERSILKKKQDEYKLGWILVGISGVFIFCQSFKIVPDLYEMIVCNNLRMSGERCFTSEDPVIDAVTKISHLLVCCNSSANFLIYYLNGEKFRKAWIDTYGALCCFCLTERPSTTPTSPQPQPLIALHNLSKSRRNEIFVLQTTDQ